MTDKLARHLYEEALNRMERRVTPEAMRVRRQTQRQRSGNALARLSCSRASSGRLIARKFATNIGPKLFHNDGNRVVPNLRAPYACGVRQRLVGVGMVGVG